MSSDHPSFIHLDETEHIAEPEHEIIMADKFVNLPVNQPVFNWESQNIIEEWKRFRGQVELLLKDGPYKGMEDTQKIATLQNWMSDRGQKIFKDELNFTTEGEHPKNKKVFEDVLDVFEAHFTPLHSMIHSWYNLGALHSYHCKDQSDFMSKLRNLAKDCGFTNEDEVVKFLFLIHNNHKRVQDQLLKEVKKESSVNDCLQTARRVEAIMQSEKLAQKMHSNQGDNVSVDAFKKSKPGKGRGFRGGYSQGPGRGGGRGSYHQRTPSRYRHPSSDQQGKCGNCGISHQPRQCPAYGLTCYTCGKPNHYSRFCRSRQRSSTPGRKSRRDMHDMEPAEEFEYDTIQVINP